LIQVPTGRVHHIAAVSPENREALATTDDEDVLDPLPRTWPASKLDVCSEKARLAIGLDWVVPLQMSAHEVSASR
jgi:hypothetical protein